MKGGYVPSTLTQSLENLPPRPKIRALFRLPEPQILLFQNGNVY